MPRMTVAEYLAHEAKHNPQAKPTGGASDESELHREIAAEIKRRGWLAFHGSMSHKTFRTAGEPDFVILADNGRVILVECKTKTGKLSTDQQAIKFWSEKLGHTIHIVRSFEEFLYAIR